MNESTLLVLISLTNIERNTLVIKMIAIVILASTILAVGLGLNSIIIAYLNSKPQIRKTSLDLVLIDTLLFSIIFVLLLYMQFLLLFYFAPLSYYANAIFSVLWVSAGAAFMASSFLTMSLKYLFIFHSEILFETSDSRIRYLFLFLRVVMASITILLDTFGPYQREPAFFDILKDPNDDRQRFLKYSSKKFLP